MRRVGGAQRLGGAAWEMHCEGAMAAACRGEGCDKVSNAGRSSREDVVIVLELTLKPSCNVRFVWDVDCARV